jgi:hypothetical protein
MRTSDTNYTAIPAPNEPSYPWAKQILAVFLAVGIGYMVASGIQHWRNRQPQPNQDILDSLVAASSAANSMATQTVALPNQPQARPMPSVLGPRLTASVIVGGSRIDSPEKISLPTEGVFALSLRSYHNGRVDVYAINPEGQSSHIWSGYLQAGQDLLTPQMRLQGLRGIETLRIVLTPHAVDDQFLSTVVRQLEIRHV